MIEVNDKTKCCGCTACYSVCPKNCIKMVGDNEGFLYPCIDSNNCINCHACERICPYISNQGVEKYDTIQLVVQNANEKIRYESTAGGVFSLIAEKIIIDGGVVFAVGYDDNTSVIHKKATQIEQLKELRGSKYVQSDLVDVFKEIKRCLRTKKVLFVGTPCQVHGLVNYIGDNDNLFLIDLLCLGVSSPALFAKYIDYLETKYKTKVKNIEFRNKYFGYATPNVRINFSDGKYIQQKYDSKVHANLFFKGHMSARPSCYECKFREMPRVSDFTIGDCNFIGDLVKNMDDDRGTTTCWIHTSKGRALFELIKEKRICTIDNYCKNIVGGPERQFPLPKDRDSFFHDGFSLSYKEFVDKWEPNTWTDDIKCMIRYLLKYIPYGKIISKYLRRRQGRRYDENVVKSRDRA